MFKAGAKTIIGGLLVVVALALPLQAVAGNQAPLTGSETGTFQVVGPCGAGGIVIDVTGTGHGTQVGAYTVHYRECFVPATGASSSSIGTSSCASDAVVTASRTSPARSTSVKR